MESKTQVPFQIRSARASDFDRIEALGAERFGAGYLAREEFERWLKYPKLFLVAEECGTVCGYCFLMPESESDVAAFMKIDEDTVRAASGGKPVLHCRSAALDSSAEHHGVMYRLLSEILRNARELGFGAAFAPAWTYGGIVPMGHLMDLLGFRKIGVRDNLWFGQENYTCVVCGGKCRCQAVIYEYRF